MPTQICLLYMHIITVHILNYANTIYIYTIIFIVIFIIKTSRNSHIVHNLISEK